MNLETNVVQVPLEEIIPNRFQPRLAFDEQGLKELSDSIKEHGVIQPLVLRRVGDKYEIIAGERRYKASTMAGLLMVPAVIADVDDNKSAEVALVENVQRRDLTPIEEAKSYKNLLDKGYMTQEQLAQKMGLSQSAISNKLRLLNLAEEVQEALLNERISERHARALLVVTSHEEQIRWLDRIINERLTVRQLDTELKKLKLNKEDELIPLVNIAPNLEAIKSNAIDINPPIEQKIIPDLLDVNHQKQAEFELQNKVDEIKPEDTQRRFFNFLEYEAANLDMSDEDNTGAEGQNITPILEMNSVETSDEITTLDLTTMPVDIGSTIEQPIVISELEVAKPKIETLEIGLPSQINDEVVSITDSTANFFDNYQNNIRSTVPAGIQPLTIEQPTQQITPIEEQTQSITNPMELTPIVAAVEPEQTTMIQEKQQVEEKRYIDPVSIIETLDPNYQAKTQEEAGLDLKTAINTLREVTRNLDNTGFKLEVEEIDFDVYYQFVIKVQKK